MAIFIDSNKKEVEVKNSVDIAEWRKAGFKEKAEKPKSEEK